MKRFLFVAVVLVVFVGLVYVIWRTGQDIAHP